MRDIVKDRKLCNAATPGPWVAENCQVVVGLGHKLGICGFIEVGRKNLNMAQADQEFIAASREALPYYINRVDELEAQNSILRDKVASLRKIVCRNCYQTDKYECKKCHEWFVV